jgi:hypothetical protein
VTSWQRQRLASLLGAVAVGLALQDAVAREPFALASAASSDKAIVLQTFHAGTFELDLAIAKCRSSECPIQVRLLRQGHVVDRVTLPVAAASQRAKAETVDPLWGAETGLKAWATGAEGEYVSTVGRVLTVAPRTTGLLVSQRFGFEHLKRNHLVILPRDSRLSVVWKAEEGAGPTWSATQILPKGAGEGEDIAYFRGFSEPAENEADRVDAVRLSWNAVSANFQETPLPDRATPLYLLNLGVYEGIAKAREERFANAYCLSPYWILDASSFPGLSGGKAVVGMVYTQRASADAAARSVKTCLPSVTASVLEWTASQ